MYPSEVILRLTGSLLTCGEDWGLAEFGYIFQRLEKEIDVPGRLKRYVRYFGETGDDTEIRFFGTVVDSVNTIPHGLVSLELSDEEIIFYNYDDKPSVLWKSRLTWDWLDRSNLEYPLGEFSANVPAEWLSGTSNSEVRFILSANSYSEQGRVVDDEVHLVASDPAWSDRFEEMAGWLRNNVSPEVALRIEHYGSTAIPGVPAKPVIDILLEVPSFSQARRNLIPLFNKPECEYWWYDDHMVFIIRDESTGSRTHHIHAAPKGHKVWEGLLFRDYLRIHPEDTQLYTNLKYRLAGLHGGDRETYTNLKADFVDEIIVRALKHEG